MTGEQFFRGSFTVANRAEQGTAQQRRRKRDRARLMFQRRGVRLVVMRSNAGQPVGWFIEQYERKGTPCHTA